jgi:hypothetical protein
MTKFPNNDKRSVNRELSTYFIESRSSLAKEVKMSSKAMFQHLVEVGLIVRSENGWDLTPLGKSKGGLYKRSDKFGRYIVWPESILAELKDSHDDVSHDLMTATAIGNNFEMSPIRINSIMSELGWIKKDAIKGWHLTELGKRLGGLQAIYKTNGVPYVRWPQTILKNSILITSIREASGDTSNIIQDQSQNTEVSDLTEFRDKFRPEHRATDGHYVRSKAELIIDNWLYVSKIVHAYERKLPIEEVIYCDFYIPTGKVYIEYWGLEDDKYRARKAKKLEIYKKYNLNLIELFDKEISNLEDKLPAKLLEFGVPIE